jgi:hypothetical protein
MLSEIDGFLDRLAADHSAAEAVFTEVLAGTTPNSFKWFVRLVLKDLKIGGGKANVLAAIHPRRQNSFTRYAAI